MSKAELEKLVESQAAVIKMLQAEIKKLKSELEKYNNSNTPPSANKHIKQNTKGKSKKSNKKKGAQKGHKGKTRKQSATRNEIIDATNCPKCGSNDLQDKKIHKKTIEDIPEPSIPEVVEYEIHEKECNNCGYSFIPKQCTVPLQGKFGFNVMVLVIFLKFILRGVLRKIVKFLNLGHGLKLTPASVGAIIKRVASAADKEYEDLKRRIKSATRVYVDETSFSVLGTNYWVWVFRTSNDILLVIRPSRGRDVLYEILGYDFKGIVICDCWRAYNFFNKLQRCWTHLLRKAKMKKEDSLAAKNLYIKLKLLFKEIKKFNSKKQTERARLLKYKELTAELQRLITYYRKYSELKSLIVYIGNNIGNWFTCVKFENVEPTNNFAEQAIRETVIVRKIIGAFRSEEGPREYSSIASLLATWKLKNYDVCLKLNEMLSRHYQIC